MDLTLLNKTFLFIGVIGLAIAGWGCSSEPKAEKVSDAFYLDQGSQIVKRSFLTLSGELKRHMKEEGAIHALQYCNANAITLTDSIGKLDEVEISRVAERNRNPKNTLGEMDAQVFRGYQNQLEMGVEPGPVLVRDEGDAPMYYQPIIMASQCVVCHGEVESEIAPVVYSEIKELYPDDLATGFEVGELRGMWKIKLAK